MSKSQTNDGNDMTKGQSKLASMLLIMIYSYRKIKNILRDDMFRGEKQINIFCLFKTLTNEAIYYLILKFFKVILGNKSYRIRSYFDSKGISWINILFDLTKCIYYNKKLNMFMSFIDRSSAETLFTEYESKIFNYFLPNRGDIVIDIGANVGFFSLYASKRVGNEGLVISIEPLPDAYECLKKNIEINQIKNILAIQIALHSSKTSIPLYRTRGYFESATSNIPIFQNLIKKKDLIIAKTYYVQTKTLDEIVKEINVKKIDWIKIDVDGLEYEIIQGAEEVIAKFRPKIIIEIHDKNIGEKIKETLKSFGYSIKLIKIYDVYHLYATIENFNDIR